MLLNRAETQDLFGQLEGMELVLKLHGYASLSAIKALDYCLMNSKVKKNVLFLFLCKN